MQREGEVSRFVENSADAGCDAGLTHVETWQMRCWIFRPRRMLQALLYTGVFAMSLLWTVPDH